MVSQARPVSETYPARRWVALPFLLVGSFLSIFDQFVINVAATPIGASLHASAWQLEAIVSGYAVVYALGLITGGRLGDKYGNRRLYCIGLAMFAATSTLCAWAWSANVLVIARLLQGASGAVLLPQVLALIRTQFSDDERSQALSWFGVTLGIGQIGGQLLGGAIPAWNLFGLSWRPIFLVNPPLCIAAFLACVTLVRTHELPNNVRLDLIGVILSAVGTAALLIPLLAFREISPWPWGASSLVASAVLLAIFVRRQSLLTMRQQDPLILTTLFQHRAFRAGLAINAFLYLAIIPFFFLIGLYLQRMLGLSSALAGLAFSPIAVGFMIGSRLGPALAKRYDRQVLVIGGTGTTIGLVALLALIACHAPGGAPALILPLAVFGLGNGTTLPIVTGVVLRHLPVPQAGAGAGLLTTAQQLSGALGVALTGAIVLGGTGRDVAPYVGAVLLQTLCSAAMLLCAWRFQRMGGMPTSAGRPQVASDKREKVATPHRKVN